MKKLIFTIIATLSVTLINAQPTITNSEHNPQVGDFFEQEINNDLPDNFNAGPSGADVTWDFSTMSSNTTGSVSIQQNNSTDYPNADIFYSQSGSYSYFKTSEGNFNYMGLASSYVDIVLSDGQEQVRFPMTYGDSYTDNYAGSVDGFGQNSDREGTLNVTADAYGTLITPTSTYDNTLRLMIVRNYTDYINETPSASATDTIYYWYAPNIRFTVMTYFKSYDETGEMVSSSANYLSNATGLNDIQINELELYPNPVKDRIKIANLPGKIKSVSITDTQGKKWESTINKKTLDVSQLPFGTYFINIKTVSNRNYTSKFVKE